VLQCLHRRHLGASFQSDVQPHKEKSIYVLRYEVRSEGRSKTKLHPSLCTPPAALPTYLKESFGGLPISFEGGHRGRAARPRAAVRRADRRSEGRCLWWAQDQVADISSSLGWGERRRQEWWLGWQDLNQGQAGPRPRDFSCRCRRSKEVTTIQGL
jgi:hypothetical protein